MNKRKSCISKRIISVILSLVMVFGMLGNINVNAEELPSITLTLSGQPTGIGWSFERETLSQEYVGDGSWGDLRRYSFYAYKDGSDTEELMWIELRGDYTDIWGGVNYASGNGPSEKLYIPKDTVLSQCTYSDSIVQVDNGKKIRLAEAATITKIDGVWTQIFEAEGSTDPMLMGGTYDDSQKAYILNIGATDSSKLTTIASTEGNILVDGASVSTTWNSAEPGTYYQLSVPYSSFKNALGTSSNSSMQNSAYVTIPKDTKIGNLEFAENMYVRICSDKMADGACLIEQVTELPKDDYYYASWNSNSNEFRVRFHSVTGKEPGANVNTTKSIYINGTAVTVNCYDEAIFQYRIPWASLGGSSLSNIGNNIIRIPSGTTGNNIALTEDVWLKVVPGTYEQIFPTTMSINENSSYDDEKQQYVIRLTPEDTRLIAEPGVSSKDISVDGNAVAGGIAEWANEEDCFVAYVPYSVVDADATTASAIGNHFVTLPKGSYVGNRILEEDIEIQINGTTVEAVVPKSPILMNSTFDNSQKAYILNIGATDVSELRAIEEQEETIIVDGTEVSMKWSNAESATCYQLAVPYASFKNGLQTGSNSTIQNSAYVTVPAGTKVGSLEFAENMYVRICSDKMADGDCLIEQVKELPKDDYYYASWNYTGTEFRVRFHSVTGKEPGANVNTTKSIYINGTAVSVNCYDEPIFQFRIPWAKLGGSNIDSIGNNIIRIPGDITGNNIALTEDVWLKVVPGTYEQIFPTTMSINENSSYDDEKQQYVIRLTPEDTRLIAEPGVSSKDISVDGNAVAGGIAEWANEEDCFVAYVPYSAIDADATTASAIGNHLVTLPKGSYVGNRILEEDITVYINGTTVSTVVKASLGDGSSYQNQNSRYVIWVVPSDGIESTDVIGKSTTILVDGEEKSGKWFYNSGANLALEVTYDTLTTGATSYEQVGRRLVTIPAGTDLGGRVMGNDLHILINNGDVMNVVEAKMSFSGNGNSQHFVLSLWPSDGRAPVEPVNPDRTIYIDGKEVENGIYQWSKDGDVYKAQLKFYTLESGATSYGELSPHCVVIPKGTYLGDVLFKEDIYFKAYNSWQPLEITEKFTMSLAGSSIEADGYKISLDIEGISDASVLAGAAPILYIEDTERKDNTISYVANDTNTIDLKLPYSVVKAGATSAEDITESYVITIPKGILFNDAALTKPISFVVSGQSVTGVIDTTTALTLGAHESNETSGKELLKFTTSPSDMLSVGATYGFITGGIAVDGEINSSLRLFKEADGVYSINLSECNVENGTVIAIDGTVQEGNVGVTFSRICFRYRTSTGWSLYEEPIITEITLTNDTINGARESQIIYMNASSDPLTAGDYSQNSFTFEDNDGEVRRHGGIKVNGEYSENVKLTKKWDGYWSIDVSSIINSLESGSVITLEGTLSSGNNRVIFKKISYIYNVDGSFSQCNEGATVTQNQTVILPEAWVNIDKYSLYDMTSASLVKNGNTQIKVAGEITDKTTLTEPGVYLITRILQNAVKAEIVGSQPKNITYEQTVHLYETGDANADGVVTAADIVRQKRNEGNTENLVATGSDLNNDGIMNESDKDLLIDLLLGRKTPEEIYSAFEDVAIGAISDMHYMANGRDGQNRINTIKALNYYKSQNVDVIIFNADITDYGEVAAYQELVEDIRSVYPNEETRPTMIFTGDNHEWYDVWEVNGHTPVQGETFYTLQERFNTQLSSLRGGLEDTNSHYVIDGYHFIGVSSDGMNGGYSTYDADTLEWLEERLEEANKEDSTKPIFLAIHQAPANTVAGSDASHYYSEELDGILANYPQLVLITSHTHASIDDEKSIYQKDYTVLNTASLYYVGNIAGSVDEGLMSEKYHFAQGLLIRANGKIVDVERCDFYNDAKIKENWIFTAGENTKYTAERAEQSTAPAFADGAAATAEWKDSTTVSVQFDAVTNKKNATSYVINVYMDGYASPVKTRTISSMYWCGEAQMPDTYTADIEGLSQQKNYRFEVVATNCWDKKSAAINAFYDGLDTEGHGPIDVDELLTLKHTLRTDANGDFKVLVLSDVQSNKEVLEADIQENIKMMVDKENPDLVLFGGDNSYGMDTPEKLRSYLDGMVGYLEEKMIPWAHVYGNHDDQNEGELKAMLNEEQQLIYEEYDYCVSKAGDPGVFGVGNFVLPVLNHNNDKIAFNIWCLDTGSYLKEEVPDVNYNGNTFYGHYEYIQRSQIEWYSDASKVLQEYNDGNTVPGMMLFHIPLQENYIAWDMKESEGLEYSGQVYYGGICSAAVNKGLFDEVVERGDVKVIVSAHDHMNDYMVKYQGVALCGSSTIGTVNEYDPTRLGGRVVTYSASQAEPVQTEMSYLYTEIPEESTVETTKVTITGIDSTKTNLSDNLNKIYLTTDVSGEVGSVYKDQAAQIHHYQPSTEFTYGISTDISWSAANELYIQSEAKFFDGEVVILPKGMTFTLGEVTYELAETYRLTCNGGTSFTGAKGEEPIQVKLGEFTGWNKNRCSYYLSVDYTFTGKTWKMFFENGANLYYGATPVSTAVSFSASNTFYIQNGSAHILEGTIVTIPKGFRFSQCGVLFEIAETVRYKCVGGQLVKQ